MHVVTRLDPQTGATIMVMDPGVDTGPFLSRRYIPISPNDTAATLGLKLAPLGAKLLLDTLPRYLSGDLIPMVQPEEGVTYAPMLKKEDGQLDFTRPAEELERRVRAFNPWPGAYMDFDGTLLKIHRSHVEMGEALVGQRLVYRDQPAVAARGGILVLDEVQPAGKKSMNGKSFLAGARHWT